MQSLTRLAALVTLLSASSLAEAGERLTDSRLEFTLQLPDGFQPHPELLAKQPAIAHAYLAHDADGERKFLLQVTPLGGILSPDLLTKEKLPAASKGKMFPMPWKEFEVEAFESTENQGEFQVLTYSVNIPLRHNAIQVSLSGAVVHQQELLALFSALLKSIEGPTNWTPAIEHRDSSALLGAAIAFVVIGSLAIWVATKRTSSRIRQNSGCPRNLQAGPAAADATPTSL